MSSKNLTHNDFPREIIHLFDKFVHGDIDRRGFIEGAGKFSISAAAAAGFLETLRPDFANAQQIAPNDARLWVEDIHIPSPQGSGTINAYLARPKNLRFLQTAPVIIVVHENRGLNPHIKDIARRLALAGYIAIAPDALTALGGYPGDEDSARTKFATLDQNKIKLDFIAACNFAKITEHSNRKIGVVGFCYGGGMVNYLASKVSFLRAGVAFYGGPPALSDVPNIHANLMLQFAADDERINAAWPAYEAALKAANKPYQAFTYPNTVHGFNNDTTPRYSPEQARIAWDRTLAFFTQNLR